jgi:ABC-type branched-subunit amino acid transport system substrate-binding protein
LTSPAGAAFGDIDAGAKARFARANAEGGVAGRQIDFVGVRDDGTDAARDGEQARVLVEQEQVFAVSPVAVTSPNFLDTFCKQVVPFFGWGTNSAFCGNVLGFGITGCQTPASNTQRTVNTGPPVGVVKLLPAGAAKTVAVVGNDTEGARQGNITIGQGFESAGFKVVYQKTPIPMSGLTDPTPIVNAIMTADGGKPPAAVFTVVQFSDAVKMVSALKVAGYKGLLITPIYDPRLAGVSELDDTYAYVGWQPGISTDVPAIAQMVKDLATYAPGVAVSTPVMAGYWSADMVIRALQKVERYLTVERFLKVLNDNFTNYVPGALPETRWPLNHIASSPCGTLAHLLNKTWTAPPETCGVITKAP